MAQNANNAESAMTAQGITRSSDVAKSPGLNWLWFLSTAVFVLLFTESHTTRLALMTFALALHRWKWAALLSPSAWFCSSVMLCSVFLPLQLSAGALITFRNSELSQSRYIGVILLLLIILVLPFATDTLIWGSFPFNIDNAGNGRLRLIPFVPWPQGGYMAF